MPEIQPNNSMPSVVVESPPWVQVNEPTLRQGDYLLACYVPKFGPDFEPGQTHTVVVVTYDVIVVTQSCDLDRSPPADRMVAVCPIHTLSNFETVNPGFKKKGEWEEVRKGRRMGLHLLHCPTDPADNRGALVVDFREVYSLPLGYLQRRVAEMGPRWRLTSPYVEEFSSAFGSYFMRVATPAPIPSFK